MINNICSTHHFNSTGSSCMSLRNWMPLSLLDFNPSKISKLYNLKVMQDYHMGRDGELFKPMPGCVSAQRWCILNNGSAIGITSENKIVLKKTSIWKRIMLTFKRS
jgi:hypothetical protein